MGTTLTGTTPQDTYDSLIKVTDNGPISGTLKALSDGLGNDSTLSLSTTAASIAGTLAVTGNATFDTNTLFVDAAANEVGIGTTAPLLNLSVVGVSGAESATATPNGGISIGPTGSNNQILTLGYLNGVGNHTWLQSRNSDQALFYPLILNPSGGNVGIGATTTPAVPLDVVGNIRSSTGILFGTDTAAANLLDDYEEGTWTMGVSFGGASVGVTTSANTGTYTKIGRKVTVNGYLLLSSKGSSTGVAKITGLPFTIPNSATNYSAASLFFINISFTNQFQSFGEISTTGFVLEQITLLGATSAINDTNFANNSGIILSFTYFV